jgi:GNAT superfamily N-acetyltransferase
VPEQPKLVDTPFTDPELQQMLAELQQFYVERYGGPDSNPTLAAQFTPPHGVFLVAVLDGETVGCAGLRRHDAETTELKRMYVRAAYRGRGLAHSILDGVEERARQLGYRRLILETGWNQPEAQALYAAHDYTRVDPEELNRDRTPDFVYAKPLVG